MLAKPAAYLNTEINVNVLRLAYLHCHRVASSSCRYFFETVPCSHTQLKSVLPADRCKHAASYREMKPLQQQTDQKSNAELLMQNQPSHDRDCVHRDDAHDPNAPICGANLSWFQLKWVTLSQNFQSTS